MPHNSTASDEVKLEIKSQAMHILSTGGWFSGSRKKCEGRLKKTERARERCEKIA